MQYNILIIGIGALGKRHLESIFNSSLSLNIMCYDINQSALDSIKWIDKYNNKTLRMIDSFEELDELDFALFSMTSEGRREMFDELVNSVNVKYILFEKVLFQKIEDYVHVKNMVHRLGIKAWVNCARRQMDSYQKLKEELLDAKEIFIDVCGSEWGMACNAIHEIDIIEFLSNSVETTIDNMELLPEVYDSKREGYKEIYGTISGISGRCKKYTLTCLKDSDVPDMMTIFTDIGQYIILEGQKKMITIKKADGYQTKIVDFDIPYQSQMTQFVLEDILLRGNSRLATLDVSARLHLELIRPLISFFEECGMEEGKCPIT